MSALYGMVQLAFEQFLTASSLNKYDIDIEYKSRLDGLKGLILHWEDDYATAPAWDVTNGGNFFFMETIASYNFQALAVTIKICNQSA